MLHGLCFGEEARSKKPCIFPCKVAAAGACRNTFQYYRILQSLHKHVPVLPYTTKLAETRSSTTVYYKACTKSFQYYRILQSLQKHVPVLPYTAKLAQSRSSTTVYYKACTNTFQYYRILQSLQKHVPVLPYTTKLAQSRSSTTVYYKACLRSWCMCSSVFSKRLFGRAVFNPQLAGLSRLRQGNDLKETRRPGCFLSGSTFFGCTWQVDDFVAYSPVLDFNEGQRGGYGASMCEIPSACFAPVLGADVKSYA